MSKIRAAIRAGLSFRPPGAREESSIVPKVDQKTTAHREAKLSDDKPFQPGVVLELGKRYFPKYNWLIVGYILATVLCRRLWPIAVGLNLSQLTNFFQQERVIDHHGSTPGSRPSHNENLAARPQA